MQVQVAYLDANKQRFALVVSFNAYSPVITQFIPKCYVEQQYIAINYANIHITEHPLVVSKLILANLTVGQHAKVSFVHLL